MADSTNLDRESYTVRRFVVDHCAVSLGDEYADTFRRDLLRMLDEVREAERERIVGIVEERAENGEPVAKLVRAIRRRGNDQTSGNAAEPSAVVTEQHAPARAPEEAGTISRTKVKHPWANVVATAVCVVDGSATQHDLVVAVRAMQDKAYGMPRSAEAKCKRCGRTLYDVELPSGECHNADLCDDLCDDRVRRSDPAHLFSPSATYDGSTVIGRLRQWTGDRSNEAKPAVAACSECGATSGSFCASLVDGKPLCFPECRPRSDKATTDHAYVHDERVIATWPRRESDPSAYDIQRLHLADAYRQGWRSEVTLLVENAELRREIDRLKRRSSHAKGEK